MWEAIAGRGTKVHFDIGEVLLHRGDLGRHRYAIRTGEVLVTATSSQGATVVLGRRGPGSVLGELAALEGAPRSATVRAATPVSAIVLQANDLETLLREEPDLALAELRRLSRQLRGLTQRYAMRSEELRTRLASLLFTHAVETDGPVFRSTREELAGWVGATREATIRALRDLETQGAISLRRGAVEIVDQDQLRSFT